ncbi:Methylcrotonoyl-CoA carboxylase subunit alpha, mitochondrial [Lachnellula subtilissima]|uniref:Methylcrotonoyl-CoA carboxylase subunit alpha, mitochondrial n=1 Tax=Lachnellula subtilissima TaxID=602034 RepID=A0A8H8RLM6_9HELO|nr:Methylcrotonoyl-CoA carboxylase subunit alpha, mitochondrial [Lachnellula subtilissima]
MSSIDKLPLQTFAHLISTSGGPKIKRILIANRGEIACRVIESCRKLNIVSIAVFTDQDALSPHVKQADQAVNLGPIDVPQGNPHQNGQLLIKIAHETKADAVHPGYGYLSENAEFSHQVREAGLVFLGPSPRSMAVLGDKRSAKQYLLKNAPSIPLIPGYNGSEQSIDRLIVEADRIGFPILIKASAGGGGKGMRIVREREHLASELARAQSEAQRSFGSSDCILERYIERSKHIEMQILGDSHGHVVSLMDRECSIQRRHQKVIEEAPSPWLSTQLRKEMSGKAIEIGEMLCYESAGTVEFIVDVDTANFYFLEVNTRIQVEHPITEETTGVDVVALQIFVAGGGRLDSLGYFQDKMAAQVGHAIECRLCAEDPSRDFVPDLGVIRRWTPATDILPASETQHVRYETAVETDSQVSIYFDPMIAKVIVWAPTRPLAIAKMLKIMAHTVCIGIRTNQSFLQSCLNHPAFHDPQYTTSFIPDNLPTLVRNPYIEHFQELQELLSFFPSMLWRTATASSSARRPFSSLPLGFRNQKADAASTQVDIVKIPGREAKAVIVEWPVMVTPGQAHEVNIVPLKEYSDEKSTPHQTKMKPSAQVARKYNNISSQIHALAKVGKGKTHRVKLQVSRTQPLRHSARDWQLQDVFIEVDSQRFQAYIASAPVLAASDAGKHQQVFAHLPALGTYMEYQLYSRLSYGESLRTATGAPDAASDGNAKAPMPCKVLSVLKKDGESVELGENVMVLESMKMEMNVLAAAKGIFKANFSKGDAVEEGMLLFTVS